MLEALYQVRVLGPVADEIHYNIAGIRYFKWGDFHYNRDHPPFSKLLGALIPYLTGRQSLSFFRTPRIFFHLGCVIATFIYLRRTQALSLFALGAGMALILFNPTYLAMVALNVNDGDVALFALLSALFLWRYQTSPAPKYIWLAFTFCLLATLSKVTGLFLMPWIFWAWKKNEPRTKKIFLAVLFIVTILFFAVYLGHVLKIRFFVSSLLFQLRHNSAGHTSALLGRRSDSGFWNYYLVHLLFKSLPVELAVWGATLACVTLFKKWHTPPVRFFIFPALTLITALSFGRVQIGLRYILPAILLLNLGCLLFWQSLNCAKKALPEWAFFIFIFVTFLFRYQTIQLSYLNFLAPLLIAESPTRKFADSNYDWNQGITQALQAKDPAAQELKWFSLFKVVNASGRLSPEATISVWAGASQLQNIFEPKVAWMDVFSSDQVKEAHEHFTIPARDFIAPLIRNISPRPACLGLIDVAAAARLPESTQYRPIWSLYRAVPMQARIVYAFATCSKGVSPDFSMITLW